MPPPWQAWDLHPSVVIGLVLLGGLYVSWGGLAARRRQVMAFVGALVVLFFALDGPLHNLSDHYLFSAHMAQHLVLTLQTNLFGCTFFVLTGTHGAHVTVGVLWLLTLWVRALQGKLGPAQAVTVEISGLYWHFVDVVWIVIFTLVYLIQ